MIKVLSLCYHDIYSENNKNETGFNDVGSSLYKISESSFKSQIDGLIKADELKIVLVDQINKLNNKHKNIFLTFDDGGLSAYSKIFPILENHGVKGHFFIVGNKVGQRHFVTAEHLREMRKYGHIIGTHSFSHPKNMAILSHQKIKDEWAKSIHIIRDILGEEINVGSIPNGFESSAVRDIALSEGISYLFTSKPTLKIGVKNNSFIMGRYPIQVHHNSSYVRSLSKREFPTLIKHNTMWTLKSFLRTVGGKKYLSLRKIFLANKNK